MKKRLISWALAFAVVLGSVPFALAAGNTANYDGHRYERIEEGMTWKEAKEFCEERGGYLATITSAEEQEVIQKLVGEGT